MLSPATMESLYSVTYLEDFLETIEDIPDEVQRRISLIIELNLTLRNLVTELETSMSYLMENMDTVDSSNIEDRSKTKICTRIQQMLMTAQDIGDQKLVLTEEIVEMLENQSQLLNIDRKNIDLERFQQALMTVRESKPPDVEKRPVKRARRARLVPSILGPATLEATSFLEISDMPSTSTASGLTVPTTKSQALGSCLSGPSTKSQAGASMINVPATKSQAQVSDLSVATTQSQAGASMISEPLMSPTKSPTLASSLNVPTAKSPVLSRPNNSPMKVITYKVRKEVSDTDSSPAASSSRRKIETMKREFNRSLLVDFGGLLKGYMAASATETTKEKPATDPLTNVEVETPPESDSSPAGAVGKKFDGKKKNTKVKKEKRGTKRYTSAKSAETPVKPASEPLMIPEVGTPPESGSSPTDAINKDLEKKKSKVKKERKGKKRRSSTKLAVNIPIDPEEPLYCLCDQVSYGDMIACDNDLCPIEWFHFSCVSLTTKPKGKWFCPNCREDRANVMKPRATIKQDLDTFNREKEETT